MSRKFTSAQRSYKTYEQEALAIIEALVKWEDKLIGRKFCIATDHQALSSVKPAAQSTGSGCLIRWDEYLSCFDFEVTVPSVENKVADCLSQIYEGDTEKYQYSPYEYVRADIKSDPELEDMTRLCTEEIRQEVSILAHRVKEAVEDRIIEAREMEKHVEELASEGVDTSAISLEDTLSANPPQVITTEGDVELLADIRPGYPQDSILGKVVSHPEAYPQFSISSDLIYCGTVGGQRVLCIPRTPRSNGLAIRASPRHSWSLQRRTHLQIPKAMILVALDGPGH
jgi:hypothetical protein